MRFQGNNSSKSVNLTASRSSTKLPAITQRTLNPELKLHFKGVEEMGNKLKSTNLFTKAWSKDKQIELVC